MDILIHFKSHLTKVFDPLFCALKEVCVVPREREKIYELSGYHDWLCDKLRQFLLVHRKPFVGCEKEHVKACEKSQQLELT